MGRIIMKFLKKGFQAFSGFLIIIISSLPYGSFHLFSFFIYINPSLGLPYDSNMFLNIWKEL